MAAVLQEALPFTTEQIGDEAGQVLAGTLFNDHATSKAATLTLLDCRHEARVRCGSDLHSLGIHMQVKAAKEATAWQQLYQQTAKRSLASWHMYVRWRKTLRHAHRVRDRRSLCCAVYFWQAWAARRQHQAEQVSQVSLQLCGSAN